MQDWHKSYAAHQRWADIMYAIPGLKRFSSGDIEPNTNNLLLCLNYIFNLNATDVIQLGELLSNNPKFALTIRWGTSVGGNTFCYEVECHRYGCIRRGTISGNSSHARFTTDTPLCSNAKLARSFILSPPRVEEHPSFALLHSSILPLWCSLVPVCNTFLKR